MKAKHYLFQAKYEHIRQTVGDQNGSAVTGLTLPRPISNTRKRIGRTLIGGQPKLFGGSLEEYLESSHQDIPQIIKSCVRIINLYGLHHQGIFRVSGSQVRRICLFVCYLDDLKTVLIMSHLQST